MSRAAWVRRGVVLVFAIGIVFVLENRIGQQPATSSAAGASARMELSAPATVRGGLMVQSRIEVRASAAIRSPELVLERGWNEGMQISSIEPDPSSESSEAGERTALTFEDLEPGDTLTVWIQSQVDPTYPGRRPAGIALTSGGTTLASISRTLTVLP